MPQALPLPRAHPVQHPRILLPIPGAGCMTLPDAIRTCLAQTYATFLGRASGGEYWWFSLAYFPGSLVAGMFGSWVQLGCIARVIVPSTAVGARRLQDTARPGWYICVPLGAMVLFALLAPTAPVDLGTPGAQVVGNGSVLLADILLVAQLFIAMDFIYWLTRPSDRGTNAFDPAPSERIAA